MVVADEDPPRKRSRLSLKAKKGENTPLSEDPEPPPLDSAGTVPQGPQLKSEEEMADCSPPVIDLTESDLPCDQQVVPPVASMENLGNTCFLNSVLEVLRYTPCFLEGLEELYRHIVYLEKIKSSDVVQSSEEVRKGPVLTWDLVKNMFKMYKKMEKREEMFTQFANADVTSMAVKPDKVLDVIRGFNPMFEGNMQHDAQEVLRCLLCYLEDSERELHSDYASILALDPSLLRTPGPHGPTSIAQGKDRQGSNAIMEKFLAAGKSRQRRGKSAAITALKFEQSPSEMPESGDTDCRPESSSTRHKRFGPVTIKQEITDTMAGGCKEEKVSPDCAPEAKKRKFQPSRLRKVTETEECDEVDGIGKKPQPSTVSPDVAATAVKEEEDHEEEESGQKTRRSWPGVRRSARQRVQSKRLGEVVSTNNGVRGKRTCRKHTETTTAAAATEEGDTKPKVSSEGVKQAEKSAERGLVNGDHRDVAGSVDKSQPTIPSLFNGKGGGRCRRLGMRGRVLHTPCNPGALSPTVSPRSPEPSPEPRRSPRKVGSSRPVAVTMSPQKQNGVMTPSVSPARPDEFPSHAVSRNTTTSSADSDPMTPDCADWIPYKSPVSAQVWGLEGLDSPRKTFQIKQEVDEPSTSAALGRTQAEDMLSTDDGGEGFTDELPDLVAPSDVEKGLDRLHLSKGVTSPTKSKLEKMLASRTKSPVRPSSLSSSRLRNGERKDSPLNNPHPSKLMIKLEKCDHLCNTPTISASAALKALKAPTNTCRKMVYGENDTEDGNNDEQDSDEDEVSLGTKSSFKSVPLKSVCVKVEKCDMVCDSPEKWVSARFATNCLARQRAQRFNIIEKLFQGTMMMRTKCLECERCTERKESFLDVSVPLCAEGSSGSDSESDEEKDSSLLRLMRAFTDVEHLRDDNKYYCEQCFRYVEAERSLHYESLPNILTVHLKRFSATGMFGCLSKINDYVTVPLLLSCMRYKCPKPCVRPDHRYTLYAIVTHAGSTISAGHYLSYIKVRPNAVGHETLSTYLDNSPSKKSDSSLLNDATSSIFDSPPPAFQSPSTTSSSHLPDSPPEKRRESPLRKPPSHTVSEQGDGGLFMDAQEESAGGQSSQQMTPKGEGVGQNGNGSQVGGGHQADYHWLECDDETIHILSEKEFHGRLLQKEGALRGTPYVLFYHRLDTWKAK